MIQNDTIGKQGKHAEKNCRYRDDDPSLDYSIFVHKTLCHARSNERLCACEFARAFVHLDTVRYSYGTTTSTMTKKEEKLFVCNCRHRNKYGKKGIAKSATVATATQHPIELIKGKNTSRCVCVCARFHLNTNLCGINDRVRGMRGRCGRRPRTFTRFISPLSRLLCEAVPYFCRLTIVNKVINCATFCDECAPQLTALYAYFIGSLGSS